MFERHLNQLMKLWTDTMEVYELSEEVDEYGTTHEVGYTLLLSGKCKRNWTKAGAVVVDNGKTQADAEVYISCDNSLNVPAGAKIVINGSEEYAYTGTAERYQAHQQITCRRWNSVNESKEED